MADPIPLAPHIHAVAIGDDLVLLDVLADQYHCIPGGAALRLRGRTLNPPDAKARAELQALGLVVPGAAVGPERKLPPAALRALPDDAAARIGSRDRLNLLAATTDLIRLYRRRPFARILGAARTRRPTEAPPGEVERLALVFRRAVVWLPAPRKCLARSFLLLRFLQRSGADADWVFGVRTWPFGAHCWLQAGDLVLDDHPEQLVIYQPLCAI